jgi:hypothetical protein
VAEQAPSLGKLVLPADEACPRLRQTTRRIPDAADGWVCGGGFVSEGTDWSLPHRVSLLRAARTLPVAARDAVLVSGRLIMSLFWRCHGLPEMPTSRVILA